MFRHFSLSLTLMFSAGIAAWAQSSAGEITGTITDATGAVAVGASVTLINPATNTKRTATSNSSGAYDMPALPPGTYNLRAELQGFSAEVRSGVELQVGQVARIDFTLKVGSITEVVEVAGGAPVLQTENTEIGTVIENKRIMDLPLNGRNYLSLAALIPGATTNAVPSAQGQGRMGGTRNDFTLAISGQRLQFNDYTLDGLENTDPNFNTYSLLPSLDALQEFKVESGLLGAQYGRATSHVNVTTKSGANQVHGSAFEFLRNSNLDAKNFFDNPKTPIPPFKRNQFGATFGGPLTIPKVVRGKDRFFFYFDYEGLRERKALTQTATVPAVPYRTGDFSGQSSIIYDPSTRVFGANGAVTSAQPFPGNVLPANRISPISNTIMQNYFPSPNLNPGQVPNNFLNTEGRPTDGNQENIRFDYIQSANSSWMFRYGHQGEVRYLPTNLPNMGNNIDVQAHQGMMRNTIVLGPNKVNEVIFGINRLESGNIARRAGVENVDAKLGLTAIATSFTPFWGVPNIQMTGFATTGEASDTPFLNWDTTIQLSDNFSWTRGKHGFKFGADIRRTRFDQLGSTVARGRFTFNGQYSNNPAISTAASQANEVADFLLGFMSTSEGQTGAPIANYRGTCFGFYAQDDWKVSSKLTVNWGLRWEYQQPWHDKYDSIVNIRFKWDNSITPTYVRSGSGDPFQGKPPFPLPSFIPYVRDGSYGEGAYMPDKRNWAPRLGVAYSFDAKTVLRAGAGLYFVQDIGNAVFDVARNAPFTIRRSENANTNSPNLTWAVPYTQAGVPSFILVNQYDQRSSYVPQWSATLQRQLDRNTSLEVGYVGSAGVRLRRLQTYNTAPPGPGNINANRPFPVFNGGFQVMNAPSHSNYSALQARLQRRLSQGFTVLSSFSWSKSIDNSSGIRAATGEALTPSNDYNLAAERGPSAFDFRRRLTNSLLYELPIGKGHSLLGSAGPVANMLLAGWQIGTILTLQDGFPTSVFCGAGSIQNGGDACYPDSTGVNPNLPRGQQDPAYFFNTSAFVNRLPGGAQFRYGNAGRNILTGPGIIDWDFSTMKDFKFSESSGIEFRAEFFNIPNHPVFGLPGQNVGTGSFGVIGATVIDSRQLQFALRLHF